MNNFNDLIRNLPMNGAIPQFIGQGIPDIRFRDVINLLLLVAALKLVGKVYHVSNTIAPPSLAMEETPDADKLLNLLDERKEA